MPVFLRDEGDGGSQKSLREQLRDAQADQAAETASESTEADEQPAPPEETPPPETSESEDGEQVPASEQQPGETRTEFIERIREQHGLDLSDKYADDDAAIKGLVEASRKIGERDEKAKRWDQFSPYQSEFAEFLRAKRQGGTDEGHRPGGEEPKPEDPPWKIPPWREEWNAYIVTDSETGQRSFRDDTPQHVRDEILERGRRQLRLETMLKNEPDKLFEPLLQAKEKELEERFQKMLDEREQRQLTQAQLQSRIGRAQQIRDEILDWAYVINGKGEVVQTAEGVPAMTEAGNFYRDYAIAWAQRHPAINDPDTIHEAAYNATRVKFGDLAKKAGKPPAGAKHTPPKKAGAPSKDSKPKTPTKGRTLRQILREKAGITD